MIGRGTSRDDALGQLGRETSNPLDMVVVMRSVFNLRIPEALDVLHALPVWRERIQRVYDDTDAFFGALTSSPCEDWWTPDQRELVEDRSVTWHRQMWEPRDAWISPDGAARPYEAFSDPATPPAGMKLVKGGWNHDHCQLCWVTLAEATAGQPEGYTDGAHRWLCVSCFEAYLAPRLEQHRER